MFSLSIELSLEILTEGESLSTDGSTDVAVVTEMLEEDDLDNLLVLAGIGVGVGICCQSYLLAASLAMTAR